MIDSNARPDLLRKEQLVYTLQESRVKDFKFTIGIVARRLTGAVGTVLCPNN